MVNKGGGIFFVNHGIIISFCFKSEVQTARGLTKAYWNLWASLTSPCYQSIFCTF